MTPSEETQPDRAVESRWNARAVLLGMAVPVLLAVVVFVLWPVVHLTDSDEPALPAITTYEQYLKARLEASVGQTPALAVDLVDSSVVLTLGGVPVRTANIRDFRVGGMVHAPRVGLSDTLSLQSFQSDIPHIPVRVVVAPRDTVEATSRPPEKPPVLDVPGFAVFRYPGLEIRLVSEQGAGPWYLPATLGTRMNVARPVAVLTLTLPPSDIRAVYRALSEGSRLALRLPQSADSSR